MEMQKEKIIGLVLIAVLFMAMAGAITFILIKNPAPEKNYSLNAGTQQRNFPPPPVQERLNLPISKTEETSVSDKKINNNEPENPGTKELSQMKITNPEGGSLLKADYLDCGKSELVLRNTSERTDSANYHITANLTAQINGGTFMVECLDENGGYHIRSGQTCKVKFGVKIWKGDVISLYQGNSYSVPIINKVTCN